MKPPREPQSNPVGTEAFIRRYPAIAIEDKMSRVSAVLSSHYAARGFDVVGCSSWDNALRKILPGQVWLIWKRGEDLRVLGMMKAGGVAQISKRAAVEFMQTLDAVGRLACSAA